VIPSSRTNARLITSTLPNPAAEATCLRPFLRALEVTARGLDAHLEHVLGRGGADLAREHALEVAHAHRHPVREVLHG